MNKTVERIDFNNPDHVSFLVDLITACSEDFFNDYRQDVIEYIHIHRKNKDLGWFEGFILNVEAQPVGVIWVDTQRNQTGYIHIAILPKARNWFFAKYFLKAFIEFCFNTLKLRKLKAEFTLNCRAYEKLLRNAGFTKEGMPKGEVMRNGEPLDMLSLALRETIYKEKVHGR